MIVRPTWSVSFYNCPYRSARCRDKCRQSPRTIRREAPTATFCFYIQKIHPIACDGIQKLVESFHRKKMHIPLPFIGKNQQDKKYKSNAKGNFFRITPCFGVGRLLFVCYVMNGCCHNLTY